MTLSASNWLNLTQLQVGPQCNIIPAYQVTSCLLRYDVVVAVVDGCN